MSIRESVARAVDMDKIDKAAQLVAAQLREGDFAEVLLSPGDATSYRFIVLNKDRLVPYARGNVQAVRDYLVVLATGFGLTYPWRGQAMHGDYCTDKWSADERPWTGEIVALFLTALSKLVPSVSG